ncbi:hypothetical protein ABMA27_000317 [Loxostege sticticalis]|uniref:Uncharacterized protein n=1 Tax=Loxostege sticticalis TaxID=481309 RepID=A0ABR3IN01_LOXSC
MHTIILIALLMAMAQTQTLDSCTEYCDLLEYDHLRLNWRPDCVCSLEYQGSNHRNNQPTKLYPHLPLENTEIYYEPSDEYSYDRTSFVEHPFYIVNPTFRKQNFQNVENRKARKIHINNREGEPDRRIDNQEPGVNAERSLEIETVDVPLYLDIDLYKSVKNGKSNDMKTNNLKKPELTEDDLTECIDLHILVYSRKSDQGANIEDMWDETKINKYKKLSDADLMIEIQSKCHQPSKIVHESLEEIKNSWRRNSQHRSSQDLGTKKHFENYPENEKLMDVIITDQNNSQFNSKFKVDNMIPLSTEEPIEMISLLPVTTDNTNFNSNVDSSSIISEINWSTDFTTSSNLEVKNVTEPTTEIIESNYNESRIDKVFKNDSLSQFSNQILPVTLETTTVLDSYTNFPELGESVSSEFLTKNDIKTLSDQSDETSTKLADADETSSSLPYGHDKHKEILEKDIRITRIFTKEFVNDTVASSINGIELIPNNDFVEKSMVSHDPNLKEISTSKTTSIPNNDFVEKSIARHDPNLEEITTAKTTSAETNLLNDLLENTTNDPLNLLRQYTNKSKTRNPIEDFTTDRQIHYDGEEPNQLNSDSNKSVDTELFLPKMITTNTNINNESEVKNSMSHGKSTERSNESQITLNTNLLKYPITTDVTPELDSFIANETQLGEVSSLDLELNQDNSMDFSSYNHTDESEMQAKELDVSSITSQESWSTPVFDFFSNGTQKAEYSTNYEARDVPELLTRNETNNIASESPYTSIPTTSQSDDDVTTPSSQAVSPESFEFDDLISSENNVNRPLFFPTTDEPYKLGIKINKLMTDQNDSSIMKNTLKERDFRTPNQDALVGKLYFLFGGTKVPMNFVQNSDGQLSLGLDGETLCDKIIQKDSNGSILMKALCNCARSKNCMKSYKNE